MPEYSNWLQSKLWIRRTVFRCISDTNSRSHLKKKNINNLNVFRLLKYIRDCIELIGHDSTTNSFGGSTLELWSSENVQTSPAPKRSKRCDLQCNRCWSPAYPCRSMQTPCMPLPRPCPRLAPRRCTNRVTTLFHPIPIYLHLFIDGDDTRAN